MVDRSVATEINDKQAFFTFKYLKLISFLIPLATSQNLFPKLNHSSTSSKPFTKSPQSPETQFDNSCSRAFN